MSYPYDVLRTRLAAQKEPKLYRSLTHAMTIIYRREGPSGFYRGVVPSLIQIIPYMGLTFMIFEALRESLDKLDVS